MHTQIRTHIHTHVLIFEDFIDEIASNSSIRHRYYLLRINQIVAKKTDHLKNN